MLDTEKGQVSASTYDIYVVGEQVRKQMHRVNQIRDRRYHLRKYKKCLVGRDAVDWLIKLCHAQSRGEAIMAMRCLQEHGMIHHVVDDHVFKDQNLFYRFTRDDDTYQLRSDLTAFYRGMEVFDSVKESGIQREFYHRGHLYQGAFYGKDLVDCLMAHDDKVERADVIRQCRELLEYDIIRHVTDDYHFADDRLMYQFHVDYDRACLLSDVLHQPQPAVDILRASTTSNIGTARRGAPSSSVDQLTGSEGSSVDTNYASSGPHSHSSIDSSYLSQPGDGCSITITSVDDDLGLGDDYGEFHGMSGKLEGSGGGGGGGGTSRATMVRKMVKLRQDEVGYGFVLRGSAPCYIHTIDPLGPAAAARLKEGQYVLSVNGQNVTNQDHRDVGRLVMTHSGLLTMVVLTKTNPVF